MDFETAFEKLVLEEGGYANNPFDPGGKTKYGITETVARKYGYMGDMKDLPLPKAEYIYTCEYWTPVKAYQLPEVLRFAMFDAAVNSGVYQASLWLQRAAKVTDDGVIGPMTLNMVNAANPYEILMDIIAQRQIFMTHLPQWDEFGRGWITRTSGLLKG